MTLKTVRKESDIKGKILQNKEDKAALVQKKLVERITGVMTVKESNTVRAMKELAGKNNAELLEAISQINQQAVIVESDSQALKLLTEAINRRITKWTFKLERDFNKDIAEVTAIASFD